MIPYTEMIKKLESKIERLRAERNRPDLEARVYALLVEFFGSNLRGDQQTLHHRLSSIVVEAVLRAEQAEERLAKVREAVSAELPLLAELTMDRQTDYERFIGQILGRLRDAVDVAAQSEEKHG